MLLNPLANRRSSLIASAKVMRGKLAETGACGLRRRGIYKGVTWTYFALAKIPASIHLGLVETNSFW